MAVALQTNEGTGFKSAGANNLSGTFVNGSGTRLHFTGTICANGASPTCTTAEYPTSTSIGSPIAHKGNTNVDAAIWEKITPPTGSNAFKVNFSGSGAVTCGICSVTGDGTGASTAVTGTSGTSTTPSISTTTTSGNGLLAVHCGGTGFSSVSDTQVHLQNNGNSHAGDNGASNFQVATGGADTLSGTMTGSDSWVSVAIDIPVAAASGGGPIVNGGQIIKGALIRGGRLAA